MSFRSGDRARAHKIRRKKRLQRSLTRVLRRVSEPAQTGAHTGDAHQETKTVTPVSANSSGTE